MKIFTSPYMLAVVSIIYMIGDSVHESYFTDATADTIVQEAVPLSDRSVHTAADLDLTAAAPARHQLIPTYVAQGASYSACAETPISFAAVVDSVSTQVTTPSAAPAESYAIGEQPLTGL